MSLNTRARKDFSSKAKQVAGLYLVFASLWIFASDRLLNLALDDPELLVRISMGKGFAFVAVTTLLLYLLLKNWDAAQPQQSVPAPRLRKLVVLFLGLSLIVPLIAFSIVRLHGPHLREAAFNDLHAIAGLKAGQIEAWLQERTRDAEVLSGSEGLTAHAEKLVRDGNALAREQVAKRLNSVIQAWGFDSAILLNAAGQALLAVGEHGDAPPLVKQHLLPAALAQGQVQHSDLYRDAQGHAHLDFVVPLIGGAPHQALAAVILHAPVEAFLYARLQSWPTPSPSAETVLVRRDGDSVLFLNDLRHEKGAALSRRIPLTNPAIPAVAAVLSGQPQRLEATDHRGVPVLAASQPVSGTPWHLIAKINREEVLAPLHNLIFWVSLVAFAAVSAVAAATLLLWRQTQRAHGLELQVQAAAIQHEGETKYRRLHESMRDAYAMVDMAGRLIDFNHAFQDLLGYSAEELHQLSYHDLTPEQWHEAEARILAEQVIPHGQSPLYEKEYRRKDGSIFPVELKATLIRDDTGQPEAMWAIVRDISERKNAEAEIRQLNAELEKKVEERTAQLKAAIGELEAFAYSVSHDLKAPLRGIDGYSRLLQEDYASRLNEEGRTFIANIRSGAQQMNQLIEDLLAYSRLERRTLQNVRTSPALVAQTVVAEFAAELAGRGVALRLAIPALEVRADVESLATILRNLLDNALKFSRNTSHPAIEIGGREEADRAILWVRDNGIGFDMRFQERIFEIFQRLQRAEDYPGTGIGLAIVRKAAQRMGGRAWAESTPGEGATFFVELPK